MMEERDLVKLYRRQSQECSFTPREGSREKENARFWLFHLYSHTINSSLFLVLFFIAIRDFSQRKSGEFSAWQMLRRMKLEDGF